ncbi:IS5/IS1182 family transposase, partial [Streptococcus pseudopneumoniae]
NRFDCLDRFVLFLFHFTIKTFKISSTTYRNHRKHFGLRMNLIVGIINHELGF